MDFLKFKTFYSTLTAETLGNLLEQNNVEYQLKTVESIVGQAGSPLGTELWVPQEQLQVAHDLLDGLITSGTVAEDDIEDGT